MNRFKIVIPFIFLAYLLVTTGCKPTPINYTLTSAIASYTNDSLDIAKTIGSSYKIIDCRIKDNKILIKAVKKITPANGGQYCYFLIINLSTSKIENIVADPFDDYIASSFDIDADKLYTMSALESDTLFITSLKTNEIKKIVLGFDKAISPGEILISQNQLFIYGDLYGIAVINTNTFAKTVFHNTGHTINPQSSTLSFPVDSSLKLLSGHQINDQDIQLYAIDGRDSIKWTYRMKEETSEIVSLLNYPNSFVVTYDKLIVALNKTDGHEVWSNTLTRSISEVYKWKDKILTYYLINPTGMYPDTDEFEYRVELKLFNSRDGKEIWSNNIRSINEPDIGICNDKLLLTDNNSFTVFSMDNGKELSKKSFLKNERSNYAFEMLTDTKTGKYYLKSYDEKIYW